MDFFDLALFATSFTTILVIQDPLGAVPIFLSLTSRMSDAERKKAATLATTVSFGVIIVFAIFGRYIFQFLGITVSALQVSGGLLLLLVALELLTDDAEDKTEGDAVRATAALVPLGTPLLAGPGAIVAAMVAVESARTTIVGWVSVALALIAIHVIVWVALRFSLVLHRLLGESLIRVLTRILGLLLAAIAVQMIGSGVVDFIHAHF